ITRKKGSVLMLRSSASRRLPTYVASRSMAASLVLPQLAWTERSPQPCFETPHRSATADRWALLSMRVRGCCAPDGRAVRNEYHERDVARPRAEESAMTDGKRSSGLERRAFLGGAGLAGVASMLAPRAALGQPAAPVVPTAAPAGITTLTAEHTVGS